MIPLGMSPGRRQQMPLTDTLGSGSGTSVTQTSAEGGQVGAVTTYPPGLVKAKAKPKTKVTSNIPAGAGLLAAVTLGNLCLGTSLVATLDASTWETSNDECGFLKTLSDYNLSPNTTFHDPFMTEHLVVAAVQQPGTWILFDSGAAANCCSRDFAPEWPLLPLTGKPPPLKSISGQPLNVYGRKLVELEMDGSTFWLHFYVCDVPYSVVSVARMLLQGYKVELEKDNSMMKAPHGQEMKVTRHGSLLFLCPSVCDFNPQRFTDVCNHFHSYFQDEKSRDEVVVAPLQPGFKAPVYYHADKWELQENFLVRVHKRARKTFFSPHGTQDRPLKLEDLADERETYFQYEDGTTEVVKDNWRTSSNPTAKTSKAFVGKTVFKLQSKPTGKKLVGKQSTLPEVQMADRKSETPTQELARVTSKVQRPRLTNLATPETQENLRQLVWNFGGADKDLSEAPEAYKQAVLKQLALPDPMTGQPYVHDVWVELPLYWVRIHYMSRTKMFVPLEHELPGLGISNERRTIIVDPDTGLAQVDIPDNWQVTGEFLLQPYTGATFFTKQERVVHEIEPEGEVDFAAQKPKALPVPTGPTETEQLEHNLTHLPFRSWCPICVQAKSKRSHSKTLTTRQPVIQMDFAFIKDTSGEEVTLLNAVDVLSGLGLSVVIPTKGRSVYSSSELRRFVLETGRTFGILQCDPEPSLVALAETVTSEVGGLAMRKSPVGWKQAQGAVGNLQATLYAQARALKLDVEQRYGTTLSVKDPIYTWLIRHAQWLMNRYLQKADGLTAYEKRWNKRYSGSLCNFGETVHFKKPGIPKANPSFTLGVWVGRCTESDVHFVADETGVYKTRSVRRLSPSLQTNTELFLSVHSTPWDPSGTRTETDHFILPSLPVSDELLSVQPQGATSEAQQEPTGETLASDTSQPSGVRRTLEDADQPLPLRQRLHEETDLVGKRSSDAETSSQTKLQRVSAIVTNDFLEAKVPVFDVRVSAVATQHFDVPVAVNEDEGELLLMKTFSDPFLWYETEFPHDLEIKGMQKEMKAMMDFGVFDEVEFQKMTEDQLQSAISTKWVKLRKPDGTVRCRLVVRGYDQVIDDPDDTFASTPSLTTLKLLLTLAVAWNWTVSTLDISTAFLHALVTGEDIFVIPPAEFYPEGGVCWKLRRALYGLKNAPRLWQDHFASVMKKNNFRRMKSDPNLYVHNTKRLYVLCYVDDLMVFGSDSDVPKVIEDLSQDLLVKVTGQLSVGNSVTFLGRQIKRTYDAIELYMPDTYVDSMLKELSMENCKPALTPGGTSKNKDVSEPLDNEQHKLYRRVVGQLLWMCNVRTDIMYATKELSRGFSPHTRTHDAFETLASVLARNKADGTDT